MAGRSVNSSVTPADPDWTLRVRWRPGWFGLDQPLHVGRSRRYFFDSTVEPLTFMSDVLVGPYRSVLAEVVEITHPQLGGLTGVDTGPTYRFELADGRHALVAASEVPGRVLYTSDGGEWPVGSWELAVLLVPAPDQ